MLRLTAPGQFTVTDFSAGVSGSDNHPAGGQRYKGRSQEKTLLLWLKVFLLLSPRDGAGSVLTARTRCSVAGHGAPARGGSSPSGFHRLFATKPVCSETSKAAPRSRGDHSSIRDSWPIAFSGYPRRPRVGWETGCPKHAAPNLPAETRSRTRVSDNRTCSSQ
jgi:hypothetical protein